MESKWTEEIRQRLLAPFEAGEVEFLPRAGGSGRALALPYIDARAVMTRLDSVLGQGGWSFDFDVLSGDGKLVRGRLTILGVTKCDAGEAGPEDEPLKAAVSDALKRAAVHFGVGRYLYHLPPIWAPYDPQKRRFTEAPQLSARDISGALKLVGYRGGAALQGKAPESSGDARAAQAVQHAETQETYPLATVQPPPRTSPDVARLQRECKELLESIGYPFSAQPKAYVEAALGVQVGSLKELSAAQWQALKTALVAGLEDRKRALGAYSRVCIRQGTDPKDREAMLRLFGGIVSHPNLVDAGRLTPREWAAVADHLEQAAGVAR